MFTALSRRVATVEDIAGQVLWVENPAPSYREGRPFGFNYPHLTMLEIVCAAKIDGIGYDSAVSVAIDLAALDSPPGRLAEGAAPRPGPSRSSRARGRRGVRRQRW